MTRRELHEISPKQEIRSLHNRLTQHHRKIGGTILGLDQKWGIRTRILEHKDEHASIHTVWGADYWPFPRPMVWGMRLMGIARRNDPLGLPDGGWVSVASRMPLRTRLISYSYDDGNLRPPGEQPTTVSAQWLHQPFDAINVNIMRGDIEASEGLLHDTVKATPQQETALIEVLRKLVVGLEVD